MLWLEIVVSVSNNIVHLNTSGDAMHDALSCSWYNKKLSCSFRRSRLTVSMTGNDAERLHPALSIDTEWPLKLPTRLACKNTAQK